MSFFTDMLLATIVGGLINTIIFWSVPIILFFVLKKKYPKEYKKLTKFLNSLKASL
jgi:hypothetical protein